VARYTHLIQAHLAVSTERIERRRDGEAFFELPNNWFRTTFASNTLKAHRLIMYLERNFHFHIDIIALTAQTPFWLFSRHWCRQNKVQAINSRSIIYNISLSIFIDILNEKKKSKFRSNLTIGPTSYKNQIPNQWW